VKLFFQNSTNRFKNYVCLWDSISIQYHFLLVICSFVYRYSNEYHSIFAKPGVTLIYQFNWFHFWPVWWLVIAYFATAAWVCWDIAVFWGAKFPGSYVGIINELFGQSRRSSGVRFPNKFFSVWLTFFAVYLWVFFYFSSQNCTLSGNCVNSIFRLNFFDLPNWLQDLSVFGCNNLLNFRLVILFILKSFSSLSLLDIKLNLFLVLVFLVLFLFTTSSPLYTLITLVSVFVHSALFLFWTHVEFFSSTILIVYVGAISILFLFVIILLNIREEPQFDLRLTMFVPVIGTVWFFSSKEISSEYLFFGVDADQKSFLSPTDNLIMLSNKFISLPSTETSDVMFLNSHLYTNYSFWFFCCGWLLFLTMVGSIAVLSFV